MTRIISIHSFRGGTGKSNMTANLATTVALGGKRVGIVDTDIQSPGIHVLFGLDEETVRRSLNDYLWGRCTIEETAYDVTPPPVEAKGGVMRLIPSSLNIGEIARVLKEGYDVGLLNEGFQELNARLALDALFIDTHPGLNEETLLSIAISDALVVILRPDKQDLQGTAVTVDVARKLGVPQMLLLINKAPASLEAEALRQQVETTYNAEVAGIIYETEEMLELASGGVFCLHYPDHPLTDQVRRVAARAMGETS
jgi:MinD-like ATPase involved in chromosome partitioning or flagellar assembly